MPILAVDQFGRIYSTSPDSEDGTGFGNSPGCVDQTDLTLGSAYLKAQARRRQEHLGAHRAQKLSDEVDRINRANARVRAKAQRQKQIGHNEMMLNPGIQRAAQKKALMAGCSCDYKTSMSGNVMTANGQSGWAGMSRDQQVIHHAVTGMGNNTAHKVDPSEARAHQMRVEATRLMRLNAAKRR